jgi:hypothetical protein
MGEGDEEVGEDEHDFLAVIYPVLRAVMAIMILLQHTVGLPYRTYRSHRRDTCADFNIVNNCGLRLVHADDAQIDFQAHGCQARKSLGLPSQESGICQCH